MTRAILVAALALGMLSCRSSERPARPDPVEGCRLLLETYCLRQARACPEGMPLGMCFDAVKQTIDCRGATGLSSSWKQCLDDVGQSACPTMSTVWSPPNCRHVVSFD